MTSIPQKSIVPRGPRIAPREKSLAYIRPEVALQWDYLKNHPATPETVYSTSTYRYHWRCSIGHEWVQSPQGRRKGTMCPVCAGVTCIKGVNDVSTTHPDLVDQWSDTNPRRLSEFTYGSNYIATWVCSVGHTWELSIKRRCISKLGCLICSGYKVLAGYNDLATTHPTLAYQWSPNNSLRPEEVSRGSVIKVEWVCPAAHSWMASPNTRTSCGSGCPTCFKSGQSKVENTLHVELSKFPTLILDPIHTKLNIPWRSIKAMETDVSGMSFSNQKFVVEFDGGYWHRSKYKIDTDKTVALLDNDYRVVRIREGDLEFLDLQHPNLLQLPFIWNNNSTDQDLSKEASSIFSFISS